MIWGKISGCIFGYLVGGIVGAFLGLILGHFFDVGLEAAGMGGYFRSGPVSVIQQAFFTATFSVMGCIARADGHVSEQEISVAKAAMRRMQLDHSTTKQAILLFRQGKSRGFDLQATLNDFVLICGRQIDLIRMFLEIQIAIAFADGQIKAEEERILFQIAESISFPHEEMERLIQMVSVNREYHGVNQATTKNKSEDAYAMLGISKSASDAEVKKAYRKLMSQHHPDKLLAKGLPKDMIKLATERTQEIKQAYEQVKKMRAGG